MLHLYLHFFLHLHSCVYTFSEDMLFCMCAVANGTATLPFTGIFIVPHPKNVEVLEHTFPDAASSLYLIFHQDVLVIDERLAY